MLSQDRKNNKKNSLSAVICLMDWCPGPDLNRYGCPYAPQTYASASSATWAYRIDSYNYKGVPF